MPTAARSTSTRSRTRTCIRTGPRCTPRRGPSSTARAIAAACPSAAACSSVRSRAPGGDGAATGDRRRPPTTSTSRRPGDSGLRLLLQAPPAARAVVRDDLLEHPLERRRVDRLALVDRDGPRRLVVVPAGDDALGVGDDRAVVEEHVHVVLRGQQRADVAVKDEIRLDAPFDRLADFGVGGVHELADLTADVLLPRRERVDVLVDAGLALVAHATSSFSASTLPSLSRSHVDFTAPKSMTWPSILPSVPAKLAGAGATNSTPRASRPRTRSSMPETRNATTGKGGGVRSRSSLKTTIESLPAANAIGSAPGGESWRSPRTSR